MPARRVPALHLHARIRPLGAQGLPRLPVPAGPAPWRAGRGRPPRVLDADRDRRASGRERRRPRLPAPPRRPAAPLGRRRSRAAARSARSSASRKRERSARAKGLPPPGRNGSAARRSAIRSRIASRPPMFAALKAAPSCPSDLRAGRDAARRERHVGGDADVARARSARRSTCRPRRRRRATTTMRTSGCPLGRSPPFATKVTARRRGARPHAPPRPSPDRRPRRRRSPPVHSSPSFASRHSRGTGRSRNPAARPGDRVEVRSKQAPTTSPPQAPRCTRRSTDIRGTAPVRLRPGTPAHRSCRGRERLC